MHEISVKKSVIKMNFAVIRVEMAISEWNKLCVDAALNFTNVNTILIVLIICEIKSMFAWTKINYTRPSDYLFLARRQAQFLGLNFSTNSSIISLHYSSMDTSVDGPIFDNRLRVTNGTPPRHTTYGKTDFKVCPLSRTAGNDRLPYSGNACASQRLSLVTPVSTLP